jgi:hypothetical protein
VHSFTRGLDLDIQAATAALTLPHHNGRTEGVNTKTRGWGHQLLTATKSAQAVSTADKGRSPARVRSGRGSLVDTADQNLPAAMWARLTRVTT